MDFNYRISGEGPDLVLVHGLGGSLESWSVIATILEKRFRVHRYDLRGHGKAGNPDGPWQLGDFVSDLEHYIHEHNLEKPGIAGFSLGGLIAQGYTLANADKVSKLAIISAVAGRTEAERQKVVERVRNLEKGDLDTNIELAMERWFSPEFREAHPDKVQDRLETLKSCDPEGYLNAYRVFATGDLLDHLHGIRCPTLIMTGEFDPGSSPHMSTLMHEQILDSQLEILPGLRHSLLVEAPELIAQKLDDFL